MVFIIWGNYLHSFQSASFKHKLLNNRTLICLLTTFQQYPEILQSRSRKYLWKKKKVESLRIKEFQKIKGKKIPNNIVNAIPAHNRLEILCTSMLYITMQPLENLTPGINSTRIHSNLLSKYLLHTYCVSDSILGSRDSSRKYNQKCLNLESLQSKQERWTINKCTYLVIKSSREKNKAK